MKESPDIPADESPNLSIRSAATAHNIELDEVARDTIDEHVSSDIHVEKGGVLVGDVDEMTGRVRIVAAVPATRALSAPASLTFTHEAWDEVNENLARDYPEHRMVGWYHSHPRFGIFLSEYDTFIQSNFFSTPWQLAYVVDPVLGKAGFFGWEKDQLVRLQDWTVRAHGGAKSVSEPDRGSATTPQKLGGIGSVEDPRPTWQQQIRVVGLVVIVLAVGVLLGYLLTGNSNSSSSSSSFPTSATISSNGVLVTQKWHSSGTKIAVSIEITNVQGTTLSGTVSNCVPHMQGQTPVVARPSSHRHVVLSGGGGGVGTCSVTDLPPRKSSLIQLAFESQSASDVANYRVVFGTYPQPVFNGRSGTPPGL